MIDTQIVPAIGRLAADSRLLETASNRMADGFSIEALRMWNADRIEVMRGPGRRDFRLRR